MMRRLSFFLIILLVASSAVFAQTVFPDSTFIKFIKADELLKHFYISFPYRDKDSNVVRFVFMDNQDAFRILSGRFNDYDSYSKLMVDVIMNKDTLWCTTDEGDRLKEYSVIYPAQKYHTQSEKLIATYFYADGMQKGDLNILLPEVRENLINLFNQRYLFATDDISGYLRILWLK